MRDERFLIDLVHALEKLKVGCTQPRPVAVRDNVTGRQYSVAQPCWTFWPLRPDPWCAGCLQKAALEELQGVLHGSKAS